MDRTICKHPDATLEELRAMTGKSCSIMAVQPAVGPMRWDVRRLVFVNESAAKTNITRLRGRGRRGQRVFDHAPNCHWNTTTMIGSIRFDGETSCMAVDGSTTREVFREYVRHLLCPTLRPGDVVIADNFSVHKDAQSQALIHARGATLEFLPPYSQDFNPIEKMRSKVKTRLRATKARTEENLIIAIGQALRTITSKDAQGYFFSCGYTTSLP